MKHIYLILCFALLACGGKKKEEESRPIERGADPWAIYESEQAEENSDDGYTYFNAYNDSTIIWIQRPENTPDTDKLDLLARVTSREEVEVYDSIQSRLSSLLTLDTDSCFAFEVGGNELLFRKEPDLEYGEARAGQRWSEYIGYHSPLKLQSVRSCSVSGDLHGFADVFLVHNQSSAIYLICHNADYCSGTPVFSPSNKYMAIACDVYIDDYFNYLMIVKVNEAADSGSYLTYYNETIPFEPDPKRIIWVNDHELLIEAHDQEWHNGEQVEVLYFYKVVLPMDDEPIEIELTE